VRDLRQCDRNCAQDIEVEQGVMVFPSLHKSAQGGQVDFLMAATPSEYDGGS